MKVLILGSGKSYHATRWAKSLNQLDCTIYFFTVHKKTRPIGSINYQEGFFKEKKGYILNIPQLLLFVQKINPDLIHVHSGGGYGFMASFLFKRLKIISLYGSDLYIAPKERKLSRWNLIFQLKKYHSIQCTSLDMAEEAKLYTSKSIKVIPFGINTELFQSKKEKKNKKIKIGIVKKLEKIYGIDLLIQAYNGLGNLKENCELHIVGEGSERDYLIKLVGNSRDVIFHGAIPNSEVPKFLSTLDIFIVPSRSEGFGVAAIEAASCQLPVIAANVGGLPEVVINNVTGLLFEKENIEDLTDKIKKLIKNESLRLAFGKNGREFVKKNYDWNNNLQDQIIEYQTLLIDKKKK
jgi:glycosyltransferase involved in cell wall biosynthesis